MTFWVITGGLAIVVAGLLGLSLRRERTAERSAAAYDLQVYREQLRELDRDLARGVVSAADAARVRTEVSRRILGADTAQQAESAARPAPPRLTAALALVLTVGVLAGSFGLYLSLGAPGYGDLALRDRYEMAEALRKDRPSQQVAEDSLPDTGGVSDASPDYIALVKQLRSAVEARPDDLQGHVLLVQSEAALGNFGAAARAQAQVLRLKGADVTAGDFADYADMLILAAGGYVSPEAEEALRQTMARDETNGAARYYLGLMMAQTGRPDTAFRMWDQLLREGPEDAAWIPPIVAQIEEMAFRAGVNYQLPEIGTGPRGPGAADVAAAQDMTPEDRMAMIEGMVGRLSDRLASEGGPVADWAQLIGALGVLGRSQDAAAIYANAVAVFADDAGALDILLRAGQKAGVAE